MKKHLVAFLLAVLVLTSVSGVVAVAVPDTNVGDSSGVVTSGADTGLLTDMTPTTAASPTTAPLTSVTSPATTRPATSMAPVTTGTAMEDEEGGAVLGIILAAIIAAAVVALAIIFIPKMRKGRNGK